MIYDQPIKIRIEDLIIQHRKRYNNKEIDLIEYSIILRDISDLAMANRLLINFDYVNKQLKGDKQ